MSRTGRMDKMGDTIAISSKRDVVYAKGEGATASCGGAKAGHYRIFFDGTVKEGDTVSVDYINDMIFVKKIESGD